VIVISARHYNVPCRLTRRLLMNCRLCAEVPAGVNSRDTGFWEVSVRCGCLWLMLRQGSLTTSFITIGEERVLILPWRRLAIHESPRTAAGPIHSCAGHRCVGP